MGESAGGVRPGGFAGEAQRLPGGGRFGGSVRAVGGNGPIVRGAAGVAGSGLEPYAAEGEGVSGVGELVAGLVRERDALAERVAVLEAAVAGQVAESVRAEAGRLLRHATDRRDNGGLDEAEEGYWSALDLAIQHRARQQQGRAWDGLGSCRWRRGDHETALAYYTRADRIADEVHDHWLKAWCLYNFGLYWDHAGDQAKAEEFTRRALSVADEHDCPAAAGWAHNHIAELARGRKDFEQAREHYAQAVRLGLDAGGDYLAGLGLVRLGECDERGGELRQAGEHFAHALDIAARAPHHDLVRMAEEGLGRVGR